ncbi:hypothetical protein IWW55_002865 [Coemansia sp. RSA 2706]|nr:hypothetical protein LPJ63_001383 [Coemansia sp. RSA 2711]KAJ2303561.1 hypothetical protein IWW55_002865 [Coemansia sp. RSA 2706]KAJ2728631.1 hypothetical protein H4R23_003605 [Coemansia sp. Cherry 401B]
MTKYSALTALALVAAASANEVLQGPYPVRPPIAPENAYLPAEIIEVGYAPQTVVAAEQYAVHKEHYDGAHANNVQGARAGTSTDLFRTRSASDSESESSESDDDTSGLESSAGMAVRVGAAAAVYTALAGVLSLL